MNKLSYILVILFLSLSAVSNAQTSAGTPDANFSIYKNKLKKSEENKTDAKKSVKASFWVDRAELMMDIFDLHRTFLAIGTQQMQVQLVYGEPASKEAYEKEGSHYEKWSYERVVITIKDGAVEDFEELDILYEDPLGDALASLEKAEELDVEGKSVKKITEDYTLLKAKLERQGVEKFFDNDFNGSYTDFATIHKVNESPLMNGLIDTTLVYYAGMAASRADKDSPSDELKQAAIKYYELAREYNYDDPELYVFLKDKYFEIGDTTQGVEILSEGWRRYPENQPVLIALINYYLLSGKEEEALEYLRIAQENDPANLSFIFAEATLYDKTGNVEKALENYNRCIEIDPNYFNAYYNLGVMFYNKAVELYKAADEIRAPKEYEEAKAAADVVLAESLPYIEKANELEPGDPGTLETLKTLYYRLQMTEQYEAVKKQIEDMATEPIEVESGL